MDWIDGYFMCPNKVLKDFAIKDYSFRIFLFIHSHDYVRKKPPFKEKDFSVRYLSSELEIGTKQVRIALNKLEDLGYITKTFQGDRLNPAKYISNIQTRVTFEQIKKKKEEKPIPDKFCVVSETTPCSPRDYTGVVPETTIRNNINNNIINIYRGLTDPDARVLRLFDQWNELKIVTYKATQIQHDRVKKLFHSKKLKQYTVEQHLEAMKRYAEVLNSDKHYIDYKWDLYEFLDRDNAKKYYNSDFNTDDFLLKEYKTSMVKNEQAALRFLQGGKNE